MNECLVTKLKASVNDDSLQKLGVVKLTLLKGTKQGRLNSAGNSFLTLLSGDVTLKDVNTGGSFALPYKLPSDAWLEVTTAQESQIEISDKYNVTSLMAIESLMTPTDVSAAQYMTALTDINAGLVSLKRGFVGNIAGLASLKNLTDVFWANSLCYGNIEDIGTLVNLTNLTTYDSLVKGTFEGLVANFRKNGRSSGSIQLGYMNSEITFNGASVGSTSSKELSWDSATITWNGTTINA